MAVNRESTLTAQDFERRLERDAPLTKQDIEAFQQFYQDFLGKHPEDRMAYLKVMTLFRRGDLREFAQSTAIFRHRYKSLVPNLKQRDLLLSFPSVTRSIHELVFDFSKGYGDFEGQVTIGRMAKEQVTDHLDTTEMFRLDLDKAVEAFPSMLPKDKEMLSAYLKADSTAESDEHTLRFLLILLADHPFLSLLPGNDPNSTPAIGKVRDFLELNLGERIEEHLVEFFVVGGGYIRREAEILIVGGVNPLFDPLFADEDDVQVAQIKQRYMEQKYQLARQILVLEFPNQKVQIAS